MKPSLVGFALISKLYGMKSARGKVSPMTTVHTKLYIARNTNNMLHSINSITTADPTNNEWDYDVQ